MIRFVDGGKRYLPGDWPTDPIPFFEEEGSVTVYDREPRPGAGLPAVAGLARRRRLMEHDRARDVGLEQRRIRQRRIR